ncbi:MAG TPA: HPr family phosphocarrier protein [Gammaproteobacteria bacterium]|jgi:phosphocarrier protein HPr|nr:MAG: HPr family phosphocarrier protein [OM182 bacterium]HAL42063.1 HPr family phosphocarrier protein [Gammaproteobacteria bacterium]|tara:strand:+ start:18388 stop:18669 length:282 start_codon:yes stop_codon:yes gene_type:complete
MTVQATITIVNPLGLHARAASKFVDLAKHFAADVTVIAEDGSEADGKRIMNLLMLGAPMGTTVEVVASGTDEADALLALTKLIQNGFDELANP